MRLAVFIGFMLVSAASAAEIYKWIGTDGQTHFGERPPPDVRSEEVRIRSFSGSPTVSGSDSTARMNGVVMFSTAWCGVCQQARQYFSARGIAYTEYDVEKSETGRAEYRRLNGRGVPIILAGKWRMDGFNAAQLEQFLKIGGR